MKNYTVMYLSMISRLAILENASRTEKAIDCLVSILRYETGQIEALSTVEAELKIVEKMFYLHEMKKGPGFCGIINNELEQDKCYIKKGQIVSLAEVALSKKISSERDSLEIIIAVTRDKDITTIVVKDNGDINESEQGELLSDKYKQILKVCNKETAELDISQKPGIGTRVDLKIRS